MAIATNTADIATNTAAIAGIDTNGIATNATAIADEETRAIAAEGLNATAAAFSKNLLKNSETTNIGLGVNALENNAAQHNSAVGHGALFSNTSGIKNTATGSFSLFTNNSGIHNTASGRNALKFNSNGSNNTGIGKDALRDNVSGINNIALGYQAGLNTDGDNNISIGNVGLAGVAGVISIGTPGTHTETHLAGNVFANVVVPSSRRFKEDIEAMTAVGEGLQQLRPVTYRYKEGHGDGGKSLQHGLIAEEVAKVFPELVVFNEDGTVEGIRYGMLTPMLLSELQKVKTEKDAEIRALELANAELKSEKDTEIAALQKRLALLEGLAGRLASIEAKLGVPAAAGSVAAEQEQN